MLFTCLSLKAKHLTSNNRVLFRQTSSFWDPFWSCGDCGSILRLSSIEEHFLLFSRNRKSNLKCLDQQRVRLVSVQEAAPPVRQWPPVRQDPRSDRGRRPAVARGLRVGLRRPPAAQGACGASTPRIHQGLKLGRCRCW
ncbi:hypothetical protein DPEC_G00141590 [Dallia pectoralis]|uniref:Uncharacterized protein n=1 Tax=Dallia pectoralis TaxID=75939 RepID=A0ACC2GMJ1_DALPE|nr:hypothetical protein DPEC_G00141590 [Dallia pectoralis]